MIQRKLIMRFITGVDDLGNEKYKNVNLNVRPQLTDAQLKELIDRYCEMTSNCLVESTIIDTHILNNENIIYLTERNSSANKKIISQ